MKSIYSLLLVSFFLVKNVTAQTNKNWGIDLHTFMDNREYFTSVQYPQSIFGVRVAPTYSIEIDSVHQLTIGLNALYEFGGKLQTQNFQPIANYQFQKNNKMIWMGIFPRKEILAHYPLALLTDTLTYFRPMMEGLFVQSNKKWGKLNVWVDWTSRQEDFKKEQFLFGLEAVLKKKNLFWETFVVAHHDAGAKIRQPNDALRDNAGAVSMVGYNLSSSSRFLDSLVIKAGYMQSYERTRALNLLRKPKGFLATVFASHKWAAIQSTFYEGDGSYLDYGDHFYRAKSYNRTDILLTPFKTKNVMGQFVWSLHFLENTIDNQQKFQVYVRI